MRINRVRIAALIAAGALLGIPMAAAAPEGERRATPGGLVYLDTGGPDEAIVLVHGWACDKRIWDGRVAPLAERWRVLTVDLPGHGESPQPQGGHSMDAYADAIAAMMDDAGVQRAVIAGHSNGVPVARQFYRRHPQRTAGLVAIDGAFRSFFEDRSQADPILNMFRSPNYKQSLRQFTAGALSADLPEAERERILDMVLETPQETVIGGMEAAMEPGLYEPDPIKTPMLVILADSPFWNEDYKAFVEGLAPDLDYRVMEDVSHFLMLDEPEAFDQMLIDFLAQRELIEQK